ncbi:MAG: hypothetical protein KKH99_04225, partial [Proteobacteria bacterium]|nr:hypothetical protein [Pseudomonadota bacterium]
TPDSIALSFSQQHMKKPLHALNDMLKDLVRFEFIRKDSIKIPLIQKRMPVTKALLQARDILKAIQPSLP